MVLLDDFVSVQNIINASSEFAEVLKSTVLPIWQSGHHPAHRWLFDGKDGLQQDARLLKVVSYLDTGDGNYWAHPIENWWRWSTLKRRKSSKSKKVR